MCLSHQYSINLPDKIRVLLRSVGQANLYCWWFRLWASQPAISIFNFLKYSLSCDLSLMKTDQLQNSFVLLLHLSSSNWLLDTPRITKILNSLHCVFKGWCHPGSETEGSACAHTTVCTNMPFYRIYCGIKLNHSICIWKYSQAYHFLLVAQTHT